MQQNYLWLSTSLFCRKIHWNHLLKEISFFLDKVYFDNRNSILLEFSHLCGQNIRFALFIPKEQAEDLARQIDDHFNCFFTVSNLPVEESPLPVEYIFLPFPQNTIQYGLYMPAVPENIEEMQNLTTGSSLSFIMIEALSGESIDDEIILTLALYLQIALIKLMVTKGYASIAVLHKVHAHTRVHASNKLEHVTGSIFADNNERIFDLANEIINPGGTEDVPGWLQKWIDLCETEINKEFLHPSGNKYLFNYRKLIYLVLKQLGLSANMEAMLFFFINQLFKSDILMRAPVK